MGVRPRALAHMVMRAAPEAAFWHGRRVLLTGHTGFKGSWLALWLSRLGARTTGLALALDTTPSLFESAAVGDVLDSRICDIRDAAAVGAIVAEVAPEIVLHLAAQPLVRRSYQEPVATIATNVMGTVNVLEAIRHTPSVRVAVMVTTDKVYANREWVFPYRETDELGGHDPYAASKAASEILIDSYRRSFFHAGGPAVASARAGNVIGGGDWSQDRLIPDAVRAWGTGSVLQVRRPRAVRPWQHVLEPLRAYLELAHRLWDDPSLAQPFNFGPASGTRCEVAGVLDLARRAFGRGETAFQEEAGAPHEAGLLALDTAKAQTILDIEPRFDLETALAVTMNWYRAFGAGQGAAQLCHADIDRFEGGA